MTWVEPHFGSMAQPGLAVGIFFASYLLGCFSTGYYYVRLRTGQDLHSVGSGSLGARNAGRLTGRTGFVITLLGDAAKGALAAGLTRYLTQNEDLAMLAALGVVLGHVCPAQFKGRGGKGIATSLGALLVYDYRALLAYAALVLLLSGVLRNSVLSGLVAFALLPIAWLAWSPSPSPPLGAAGLAALIWIAHRKNLAEAWTRTTPPSATPPRHQP